MRRRYREKKGRCMGDTRSWLCVSGAEPMARVLGTKESVSMVLLAGRLGLFLVMSVAADALGGVRCRASAKLS